MHAKQWSVLLHLPGPLQSRSLHEQTFVPHLLPPHVSYPQVPNDLLHHDCRHRHRSLRVRLCNDFPMHTRFRILVPVDTETVHQKLLVPMVVGGVQHSDRSVGVHDADAGLSAAQAQLGSQDRGDAHLRAGAVCLYHQYYPHAGHGEERVDHGSYLGSLRRVALERYRGRLRDHLRLFAVPQVSTETNVPQAFLLVGIQ